MIKKEWGIGLSILGLLVIAISFEPVQKLLPMIDPLISKIPNNYLLLIGAALVIGGVLAFVKFGEEPIKEVPIYHGEKIVGYRRMHQ